MGYSNKRRRSKRRRTRTLNALHSLGSADDSSVDQFEQSSSYASFCSTKSQFSHATSDASNVPPNSIFMDDTNIRTPSEDDLNNVFQVDSDPEDQFFEIEIDEVDHILNYSEAPPDDMSNTDDVTVQSTISSSLDPMEDTEHSSYQHHHRFDLMSRDEIASYKIMSLLDNAGAPRICYNRLTALLKKLSKHHGFDVQKAVNRETLMKRLERTYKTRPRVQRTVLNKQEVFRFCFQDMLQDLINSNSKYLHEILPANENEMPATGTEHELWNTTWMRTTFESELYKDFNPETDIMLPMIIYTDKTGIDVNQRYGMEPVLISTGALPRERRESRHSWRHLGFVPQRQQCSDEESLSDLQFYHDCMSYLLDGLREAQKNPPIITVKLNRGGTEVLVQRRAFLPLMVVMGDQLSQDTLCARLKSNAGGAGRVHRSCMCSYLHIDDPFHRCKKVNLTTLNMLTTYAMTSDKDIASKIDSISNPKNGRAVKSFLQKQRTMFRSILRHPFTTHPIKNAFEGIDFGSWSAGIHDATFDDFMHSVESGMISYITETVYDGLTKKEKESVEELTRPMLDNQRCSVISTYPRWRLQPGFTRQTLMTSGERVGGVLALCLSLQNPNIREVIRLGHSRQTSKYLDLSTESATDAKNRESDDETVETTKKPDPSQQHSEFYLNQHMHTLDDGRIRHTLEHMIRHGFHVDLIDDLDPFQINQMVWHCADMFKHTRYPDNYPTSNMEGSYTDLGGRLNLSKEHFALIKYSLQTTPFKLLKHQRHRQVEGTTGKHLLKKVHKKGEGSSAAVLTNNMGTLVVFLEYVLTYHAFCKYSWTLPLFLQQHYTNIQAGNRFVVEYFQKLLYRGNCTVDSRFPKIHSQSRMADNTIALNTVMNFCCETGERLLKTEAKGISRTAQQRGDVIFLAQTMSRLQERSVLDSFSLYIEEKENKEVQLLQRHPVDQFGRTHPHFLFEVATGHIKAVSRKNEATEPDHKSGILDDLVLEALKRHEPSTTVFEIYNEVILRDNARLRASTNYANSGPWYDYANVSWERMTNGVIETYLLPAKCLCFFRQVPQQPTGSNEVLALIQSVDPSTKGKVVGHIDTLLTTNYRMEFDKKGRPKTHVVPVASIDSPIRCFAHVPSTQLFNPQSPGITYLLPRNHWAYMWMALNDVLTETNTTAKVKQRKGKLNSLSSNLFLENVRERYQTFLHASCMEDLQR